MTEVVVVGAGPTGLTATCELARRGVRVRLVDGAAGPFPGSRGKGMQPRTLEVLDGLGLAGRLVALGRFRLPARQYDATGGCVDRDLHPGVEPTPDSPYARAMVLPQWRTESVLRELLGSLGVEVEWGRRVVGLGQSADGVRLTLADGSALDARCAIGCDGGSSTLRRLLGVSFLGETREDVRMLLGDVELEGLDRDHWHMWVGDAGLRLALCPLPATETFQFQAVSLPGETAEPSLEACQAVVDAVTGPLLGDRVRLRRATWLSRWRLNVRMVDRYRVGRVFLAGDAAHVHSPAGGQGMNTGIQDAANLGWKLAAALDGAGANGTDALLDTYSDERLPVAAEVLGLSSRLGAVPPGSRGAAATPALQLGVSYRGGPLAPDPDPEGAGPRPGDRAPDAPCRTPDGRPVTLFDLRRGPDWTLLGFGVRPEVPGVRVVALGSDVLDHAGHAQRAYAAAPGELVLIRPDGHITVRTTDEAGVHAYLRQWLGVERAAARSR